MPRQNDGLSEKEAFDVLSSDRRRFVLSYLEHHDGTATLNELARALGAREYDVDEDELTDTQRRRLYVSLYQTHVPKMENYDIVEYDGDTGVVSTTERVREVSRYLRSPTDEGLPWHLVYLALSVVWVVLIAAFLLGGLFDVVDGSVVSLVVALTFVVLALLHRLLEERDEGPAWLLS